MRWWPRKASQNDALIDAIARLETRLGDLERRFIEQEEKTAHLATALIERIEAVRWLVKERREDAPN